MYCKKRLCLDDSEMVVETMDSTVVDMADGPSSPEEVKESLELDVDTFSVRAIEDDSQEDEPWPLAEGTMEAVRTVAPFIVPDAPIFTGS